MQLDLHLKRQNVYTIQDIGAYLTGVAGQFSNHGYYIDGMIFNTETPVNGFSLRSASHDDYIEIGSYLDKHFYCDKYRDIDLIDISIEYHDNEVIKRTIQKLCFVRPLRLFVTSYETAKKMVDKHKKRLVNYDGYFDWVNIPVTKANVKLLHGIKGFKTIKPDSVELSVMTRINYVNPKSYRLHNIKTGRFTTLDLNTVHVEEIK